MTFPTCRLAQRLLYLLVVAVLSGCARRPTMTEFPPLICPLTAAPIVVAGQTLTAPAPVSPPHKSRFDNRPTQLFQARVNVENVLKGDVSLGPITVYFYMNVDPFGGNERLAEMVTGERDVLFLLRDAGELRIVCDGGRACVPKIYTGAHPHVVSKAGESLEDEILTLLLSRGAGASDEQMIKALGKVDLGFTGESEPNDKSFLNRLAIIAQTETPPVAAAACSILGRYDHPCVGGSREKVLQK